MPVNCPQCGAPLKLDESRCNYCGETVAPNPAPQPAVAQQPVFQQPPVYAQPPIYQQTVYQTIQVDNGIDPSWPIKSKLAAGFLGIFLGGLGIHKFYMGRIGWGIIYLLFCWTYIPAIIGFIEGIVYIASNDVNFQRKHHVRLQ